MKLKDIKILNEGGAATSGWGTTHINKGDIPATIKYVSKVSGIPTKDLHALGSVGKKAKSGDIDLAVDITKHNMYEVHEKMMKEFNDEGILNKGTKIGSYAVPIQGNVGKVQVDLMFVPNTDWANFAYHSPSEGESRYKGVIRTILLRAVAAALNEPGTDHFEYDDSGELLIRAGRTMELSSGLRRIFQHRPKKSTGEYLKTLKSIPLEDFKKAFPEIEISGDTVTIDDPKVVVQALFGPNTKPSDVGTAEKVLYLIHKQFGKDADTVFSIARSLIKATGKKLTVPEELK